MATVSTPAFSESNRRYINQETVVIEYDTIYAREMYGGGLQKNTQNSRPKVAVVRKDFSGGNDICCYLKNEWKSGNY